MSLGIRINEIRKEKKISLDELSVLSGVPKGTLSKITAGITTSPTLDTVRAIAKALDCRLDDFDDLSSPQKQSAPAITAETLDEDDLVILEYFHTLSQDQKQFLLAVLQVLSEQTRPELSSPPAGADAEE